MNLTAAIVWLVALLAALPLTLVAVLMVTRIVVHLRAIDLQARTALRSIEGIGRNSAALPELGPLASTAQRLGVGADGIAQVAVDLGARLRAAGLVNEGGTR